MVGVALGQQAEDVEADNIQEGVAYKNNTECLLTAFQITNSYFQKKREPLYEVWTPQLCII